MCLEDSQFVIKTEACCLVMATISLDDMAMAKKVRILQGDVFGIRDNNGKRVKLQDLAEYHATNGSFDSKYLTHVQYAKSFFAVVALLPDGQLTAPIYHLFAAQYWNAQDFHTVMTDVTSTSGVCVGCVKSDTNCDILAACPSGCSCAISMITLFFLTVPDSSESFFSILTPFPPKERLQTSINREQFSFQIHERRNQPNSCRPSSQNLTIFVRNFVRLFALLISNDTKGWLLRVELLLQMTRIDQMVLV